MKEKDGYTDCPEQQVILYVEKDDGQYGAMQTGSYLTANYLDDYFHKRKNLEAELQEKIDQGEINAIGYYMVLEDLTVSELASRAGLFAWTVRRHLKPSNFKSVGDRALKKYATVFNVPVEDIIRRQSGNSK
jgi:hypothetical protein